VIDGEFEKIRSIREEECSVSSACWRFN